MALVTMPEAARVLRRSPRHLPLFCLLVSGGLAVAALGWGVVLLVALPRGLGDWLLGPIWRPTYPLVLPQTLFVMAMRVAGAGAGLHALGAARRSLRSTILASVVFLACALVGAVGEEPSGRWRRRSRGMAGRADLWWQLRAALREAGHVPAGHRFRSGFRSRFRSRRPAPRPRGLAWGFRSRAANADAILDPPDRARGASGRLLVLDGRLLGPLLAGRFPSDKAFAYIHLPGTPLYVGEIVLRRRCPRAASPPPDISGSRSRTNRF